MLFPNIDFLRLEKKEMKKEFKNNLKNERIREEYRMLIRYI